MSSQDRNPARQYQPSGCFRPPRRSYPAPGTRLLRRPSPVPTRAQAAPRAEAAPRAQAAAAAVPRTEGAPATVQGSASTVQGSAPTVQGAPPRAARAGAPSPRASTSTGLLGVDEGNSVPGYSSVFIGAAEQENGEYGNTAGYGVFWGANDPRNRSGPVDGRATADRAHLQALTVALDQAIEAQVKLTVNASYDSMIHMLRESIEEWKKNGWKSGADTTVENIDLLKKINRQLEQVTVTFVSRLSSDNSPSIEEAHALAVGGLETSKAIWSQAKKVFTNAACLPTRTGLPIGAYGVFWNNYMTSVTGSVNGIATEIRAQLRGIAVALNQAVNAELERVVVCVASEEVHRILTHFVHVWKSNGWLASDADGVPAPQDIDLIVEIDSKKNDIQVAFKWVPNHYGLRRAKELADNWLSTEIAVHNERNAPQRPA